MRSAARLRGDTLVLVGPPGSLYARLAPPGANSAKGDVYTGDVTAVSPKLQAPGTPGPQVQFALTCFCRTGTTAFGQPRYEHTVLGGRYAVRALGGGRYELRQVPEYEGGSAGSAVDTLEKVR